VTVIDPYSRFDVNRDGVVDLADVAAAAYFFMKMSNDADWSELKTFDSAAGKVVLVSPERCDVDRNGQVDIEDLILILANFS
jgi:Ca2+-binding EF-hand superfamily protein